MDNNWSNTLETTRRSYFFWAPVYVLVNSYVTELANVTFKKVIAS